VSDAVSNYLREHLQAISDDWTREILARRPELTRLPHGTIVDHLPEFLRGLAHWIDGDEVSAQHGFEALADGHALTRQGHGIELDTLFEEYRCLRGVIGRHLGSIELTQELRVSLRRLHDGLDQATAEAIRRFSAARDLVRERFIGILGHDLRNPLHAVTLAAAQIASRTCSEPRHARLASTIQRSSERMMRMIAEIIDFANAHLGGGIPADPVPCDMGEVCDDAVQELRLAYPDRDLRIDADGDLRGAWDRDRVMQVISNLIGNAIAHGSDPIIVHVCTSSDNERVITRVTNGGAEIPAAELAHLFDPFVRGQAMTRNREGMGLGLYIVKQIALAHGALINVTSRPGETAFEIAWPRVPLAVAPHR
jgi:signal transduction histidine kinase